MPITPRGKRIYRRAKGENLEAWKVWDASKPRSKFTVQATDANHAKALHLVSGKSKGATYLTLRVKRHELRS